MGSGEGCHLLGLGESSGTGEGGAAGVDRCLVGEAPCIKVEWVGHGCLSHQYVIGGYQCASEFCRSGL